MSDLRKAAEMALEGLETLWDILDDIDTASDMAKENDAWYRKRVEALQKKRWDTTITTDGYKLKGGPAEALRQALAQPDLAKVGEVGVWGHKHEWVGLTADEIWKCNKAETGSAVEFHICVAHQNVLDFAEAIEAKLKEKNGG